MSGPALERVLQKLQGVKAISAGEGNLNGYVARCPAHEDSVQSLQVTERHDMSVGLHCHAGCTKSAVIASMDLKFADLYSTAHESGKKTIVATYDYRALDGKLLYQAVRFFPKEFRQRHPDGTGGWSWSMLALKGKHVAYRLPDLKGHNEAFIVEGEKDADRLWQLGLAATTNIGGAGKWGTAETKSLVAAGVSRLYVIPDNDDPGRKHAEQVARSAKLANLICSIHELPDIGNHGDVSDWLMNGGSKDALLSLVATPTAPVTVLAPPNAVDAPAAVQDDLDVTQYHLTDLGAAESFRDRFGDRIRFDHQQERWLIWDGHFWKPDLDDEAYRLANEHVRLMQADALKVPDYLERKKYLDFAMGREKRGPVVAMLSQAAALKPIAISGEGWDSNGMILGCTNGIIDLKTGDLRPGERADFVTLQTGQTHIAGAACGRWLQFLDEVFDGDATLIDYIHRAVGYSLTADMREQCFFVLFGSGSNGKSIFIDVLESVFGTYGHRADMRMFAGHSHDANAFQNADFRGKRLVFAAEVRPGARMNEHVLKHLTGGESLRAEHKYGRSFTIRPVGKIWLSVNHRPKVADESYGFWRRVRLVPFLRTFAGSGDDRTLKDKLRAEASGILSWAVQGCLKWQQEGLDAPNVVRVATDEYQQGEDPLGEFFEQCTVFGPETADSIVSFSRLYTTYKTWMIRQGYSDRDRAIISPKALGNSMQTRPFLRVKQDNSVCYKGFELIDQGGSGYQPNIDQD